MPLPLLTSFTIGAFTSSIKLQLKVKNTFRGEGMPRFEVTTHPI